MALSNRHQVRLLGVFVCSLVLVQIVLTYGLFQRWMFPEDYGSTTVSVLELFGVPLGVLLGGLFGQKKKAKPTETPFVVVLVLSVIWCLLLVVPVLYYAFSTDLTLESLNALIETVAPKAEFLISGALAFVVARVASAGD